MEYPPRCKHGWMSSCLEGCEDAYKPDFDDVWEYLVRLNVSGEVVVPVITDGYLPAMDKAVHDVQQQLPCWMDVEVEGVRKADPPSMKFFLRNVEREVDDVSS